MKLFLVTAMSAAFGLSAVPAIAQDDIRTEKVHFDTGTTGTSVKDSIKGYETVSYKLGAEAGQTMQVTLSTANTATYFNVYVPGNGPGDEALANAQMSGSPMVPDINMFNGALPVSGEYTISVYMMRSAARRDEVADYTLDISITGATEETVKSDYADGMQGGPDFWAVNVSDPAGSLNVHSGPSAGSATIGTFPNRETLRNLGCRMNEGRRWCQVEGTAPGSITGWVAGDYLVEGIAPSSTPAADQNAAASGGTPTAEEQACLAAVSNATNNGNVTVLSSEFSQAGTLVMIGVGEQKAPWKCIAYSDGRTDGIEFQGEG